jgi:hypothetical protein
MPKEVKDIKNFIEICRRKDASCKSASSSLSLGIALDSGPESMFTQSNRTNANYDFLYSGAHQEEQEEQHNQVQSPLQAIPLHPRPQRPRARGETQAESTTGYLPASRG